MTDYSSTLRRSITFNPEYLARVYRPCRATARLLTPARGEVEKRGSGAAPGSQGAFH